MPVLCELAVLGAPTSEQTDSLEADLSKILVEFRLTLGDNVRLNGPKDEFDPDPRKPAAAVFFGGPSVLGENVRYLLNRHQPVAIVPVVSDLARVEDEIPPDLRRFNSVVYRRERVASALLECAGLLSRRRSVFLSYRRSEARGAALQLHEELAADGFDVFLDTHRIRPGDAFQPQLTHRLCDSDVLLMLDTEGYFNSLWTDAEFSSAEVKGVRILRVGWPGVDAADRLGAAEQLVLSDADLDSKSGELSTAVLERLMATLESLRASSVARRITDLMDNLSPLPERLTGSELQGAGARHSRLVKLPDGTRVQVFPRIGEPSSKDLQEAVRWLGRNVQPAVLFDPVGLDEDCVDHLDWLDDSLKGPRWLKCSSLLLQFANWRTA